MIRSSFFAALLLILAAHSAQAQKDTHKIGIGLMVGEPTGLSFKAWTSSDNAIDAGLAWSLGRYDAVNIHADYLWHYFKPFNEVEKGQLPVYVGVGGRIIFADDYPHQGDNNAILGVRVPVGLNYLFEDSPVGVFLEIVPVVNLIPETDFDLDGALGVRLYL